MLNYLAFSTEAQYEINWVLGCQSENRFMLMKAKYPIHIMMFVVVTTYDDFTPPFIFLRGLRLNTNTKVFIKCLEDIELTWIERVATVRLNA